MRPQGYDIGDIAGHVLYSLSSCLSRLNPHVMKQALRQVRNIREAPLRFGGRLPEPETYAQQVQYTLPFEGWWLVANGGTTPETSHSWDLVEQRYAYDFVRIDESGHMFTGKGVRLTDYFAYGAPILAPAEGVVVEVRDDIRDWPIVGTIDFTAPDIRGNFVVIQHAANEYSLLAHLRRGSICVRPGERVRRGQKIAECGNSGHSTQPHLHFQVQDRQDCFESVSLPVGFARFKRWPSVGERPSPDFLQKGDRVAGSPILQRQGKS